jgi:A/G-specific adenine glycosylase
MSFCRARALGIATELPRRQRKPKKPVRHGIAWVGRREDGLWLLERRPDRGLLGRMLGWPGTGWDDGPPEAPPASADWSPIGEVRHTFTHFHLVLEVRAARVALDATAKRGRFRRLDNADLPTVMRKAHALAAPLLR